MKMRDTLFFISIILLGVLGCSNPNNPLDDITGVETQLGTIQGDVQLIEGVAIQLNLRYEDQLIRQVVVEGSFELKDLDPGNYSVMFVANGFEVIEHNVTITEGQTVSLEKVVLIRAIVDSIVLPPQSTELPPGEGLNIGVAAPNFQLSDGNHVLHSLTDYTAADRKVVLVFYRTSG